jgi:hypothetical protein
MPNFLDGDEIEATITRAGSTVVAIVFSKEQAAQMVEERPQLFLCVNIPKAALCRSVSECEPSRFLGAFRPRGRGRGPRDKGLTGRSSNAKADLITQEKASRTRTGPFLGLL